MKEPTLRKTTNGKSVVSITVACNRDQENTDFINCVAWNGIADTIVNYFKKGHRIGLTGRWQTRNYKDDSNRTIYVNELLVRDLMFLESKKQSDQQVQQTYTSPTYSTPSNDDFGSSTLDIGQDDLPF